METSSEQTAVTITNGGVAKSWLADGQILCYRFTDMTRTTVDSAVDALRADLLGWDNGQPWRLLLDIQHDNVVVSAYALHRAREIARVRPELAGKTVILTTNVLTAQIASMALRGLPSDSRQRLVFSSEPQAVAWLLQTAKINP